MSHYKSKLQFISSLQINYRNHTESAELVTATETSLSLQDILPLQTKNYDKNRAPKMLGQPTVVCKYGFVHKGAVSSQ